MERVCGGLIESLEKIMNEQYMSPVNAGKTTQTMHLNIISSKYCYRLEKQKLKS